MKYITTVNGKEYLVDILDDKHIMLDGKVCEVDFDAVGDQPVFSLLLDGESYEAYVSPVNGNWQVLIRGRLYTTEVEDEREKRLRARISTGVVSGSEFHLKAPMPGLVVAVPVEDKQSVQKGDVLVILESMKMQNELRSPHTGTVTRIKVKTGDRVEQHQTMLSVLET